jgi:superfamily II DNA helicase RecQ
MQYRVFAIPATGSPELEEELNLFLRSHKIIAVNKSVEDIDGTMRWCFCVEYLDGGLPSERSRAGRRGGDRIDYKDVLNEADFAMFALLRDVRKQLAAAEAIPVYAVCTNEHLAAMATKRPKSLTQLKEIEGLGEAKAGKYGEAFLQALNTVTKTHETGEQSH